MNPTDIRRHGPASSSWRLHPGCSLGRGRLGRETDEVEGATRASKDRNRKYAEWTSFAISAGIVLGILGIMIFTSVTDDDRPASISVTPMTERLWSAEGTSYLPVEVANTGTASATDLRVLVDAGSGAAPAEIRADVLAGGATIEAVIGFETLLDASLIRVQSVSYVKP